MRQLSLSVKIKGVLAESALLPFHWLQRREALWKTYPKPRLSRANLFACLMRNGASQPKRKAVLWRFLVSDQGQTMRPLLPSGAKTGMASYP